MTHFSLQHITAQRFILVLFIILSQLQSVISIFWCSTAFQCAGQSINTTEAVYGVGYKSLFGASTIEAPIIQCAGSFACYNVSLLLGKILCSGTSSCSYINRIDVINEMYCYGASSCRYSNFNSSTTTIHSVKCEGTTSCEYSQFRNVPRIYAQGAFSLYNSTIYSNESPNNLEVTLKGYQSGFASTIYCQIGHSCTINCDVNGCQMLYISCIGWCTINTNSVDTVIPITRLSQFDGTKLNLLLYSASSSTENDAACNAQSTVFTYDNDQEHINGHDIILNTDNAGPICCRGSSSCNNVDINVFSNTTTERVVCSGGNSCFVSKNINSNQPVFCEGNKACASSNINSTDIVYCIGDRSCGGSFISNAKTIYCSALRSCEGTMINSSQTINVYLLGKYAGIDGSIHCSVGSQCFVFCKGSLSCFKMIIYCNGECMVECNADSLCPQILTPLPTYFPTYLPSPDPTKQPTETTISPTKHPSLDPTHIPSHVPSEQPSRAPTNPPSFSPTLSPTTNPSINPSLSPTFPPTISPSISPTSTSSISPVTSKSPSNTPLLLQTYLPTTSPTNIPTDNPTLLPTQSPTVELSDSHLATDYPTFLPNKSPTSYLYSLTQTIFNDATDLLKVQTTSTTDRNIHGEWIRNNYYILLLIGSVLLIICVGLAIYCCKQSKIKDVRRDIIVKNAMVILIAIGMYDQTPSNPDEELNDKNFMDLAVEKDIQNLCHLFNTENLNYTIFPKYEQNVKLHWTEGEIVDFLTGHAAKLNTDINQFDSLIVVVSCHGMKNFICTSDYKLIEKCAIHRIFTWQYPEIRKIPRIFMFDCCSGGNEFGKYFRKTIEPIPLSNNPLECDIETMPLKQSEETQFIVVETEDMTEQTKQFTSADVETNNIIWGAGTKNPDYMLVEINASNPGFQSKLSTTKGSYMIYEFVEKIKNDLTHNSNKYIYEIFDEIQYKLESQNIEQTKNTYNNGTRYIKLKRNRCNQNKSTIELSHCQKN
eukprot:247534_1